MDWKSVLVASLTLVIIAIILGLILALANKFLMVKEDPRKEEVLKNMPGANCGGCGYPGCAGLVDAIMEGKVTKIGTCRVLKQDKKTYIVEYLNSTPGEDGKSLKVVE